MVPPAWIDTSAINGFPTTIVVVRSGTLAILAWSMKTLITSSAAAAGDATSKRARVTAIHARRRIVAMNPISTHIDSPSHANEFKPGTGAMFSRLDQLTVK